MCVQIVHHQCNLLCVPIALCNVLKKLRPIHFGLVLRHLGHPRSSQRLTRHEYVTNTTPLIFVVVPFQLAGASRNRCARFADELPRCLVHADYRNVRIVRSAVHVENPFHRGDKFRIGFGRNYPANLTPRLDFVFFSTRRTVSWERLSAYSSSTARSASKRSDHRAKPSGGSPQLRATRCASSSPSALRS